MAAPGAGGQESPARLSKPRMKNLRISPVFGRWGENRYRGARHPAASWRIAVSRAAYGSLNAMADKPRFCDGVPADIGRDRLARRRPE